MSEGVRPRPLRVLHVMTVSESLSFLRGQARFMADYGFELGVATARGDYQATFVAGDQARVFTVDMGRRISPMQDVRAIRQLVRVMSVFRPDIVHSHTPKGGLLGMVAATISRIPCRIYHVRGLPLETARSWKRGMLYTSEWISCRLASRVISVSPSLQRRLIEKRLCSADKLVTVHKGSGNGVDCTHRFNPPDDVERRRQRERLGVPRDAFVLLFVGRLAKDKGLVELAEAWKSLSATRKDLLLIIAGSKDARDPVDTRIVCELSVDPRVQFLGNVSDMRPVYCASDLLVLPSHREGFPNVPLEAAAMELPVVTTDATGCVDSVVDGATGRIVPVGDAAALAQAIAAYAADRALAVRHGQAGRQWVVEEFKPEIIWAGVLRTYLALLRQHGKCYPTHPVVPPAVPAQR